MSDTNESGRPRRPPSPVPGSCTASACYPSCCSISTSPCIVGMPVPAVRQGGNPHQPRSQGAGARQLPFMCCNRTTPCGLVHFPHAGHPWPGQQWQSNPRGPASHRPQTQRVDLHPAAGHPILPGHHALRPALQHHRRDHNPRHRHRPSPRSPGCERCLETPANYVLNSDTSEGAKSEATYDHHTAERGQTWVETGHDPDAGGAAGPVRRCPPGATAAGRRPAARSAERAHSRWRASLPPRSARVGHLGLRRQGPGPDDRG